ncbi:hypothetical protein BJG93_00705 [Paraburkholderia sprentiae WSM5005]|uniref:Uncharacterized protein n=1 Tax=Paraburkholderia sprentiae WSM5005 TaxID=754502 RepID=A0A1I9YCQ4_9BURK|nr:hypothetical protein [Paraburkholderia sprentiae]APA84087.1 hypothetical protein BJG93_00705 [Paraburkholderia sprentiae WSM5005]
MSIYLEAAGDGPDIVWLSSWSIRESHDGAKHFVGYSQETRSGRVSTKIVQLDGATRTAGTLSGRIYQLVGRSGYHPDAEYVFSTVANGIGGGKAWRDVTAELIPDCNDRTCVTANPDEVALDAAARLLFLSRLYLRSLIADGKIPARVGDDSVQWIPIGALKDYRARMRTEQQEALIALIETSQRMGLYDAEAEELPEHQKRDVDNE